MDSKHLVDKELLTLIDLLPKIDFSVETLPASRKQLNEMFHQAGNSPDNNPEVKRQEIFVPGPEGAPEVRVLTYTPTSQSSAPRPAYFYIHGGGYVLGSPEQTEQKSLTYASQLDCVVVAVDYRLAPETAFPGNVEDCYSALKWLYDNATELGVDPTRIAIGGESAGGGLTATLALLTRDRGEVPVIHQQLVYPMLDDRPPTEPHPYAGEFGWTAEQNHFGWKCLLGCEPGSEGVSNYAAAARADKLEGLPPAFISVGSLDLLMEEDVEYARRLLRAGVPCELHIYPGAFHGSDMLAGARISQMHLRDQIEALRMAFNRCT